MLTDPDGMAVSKAWKWFWRITGFGAADLATGGALSFSGIMTLTTAQVVGQQIADIGYTLSMIRTIDQGGNFAEKLGGAIGISADYWLFGGSMQDEIGHTAGLLNTLAGGRMDFQYFGKSGNVVYSEGPMYRIFEATDTWGSEYLGRAIFVKYSSDRTFFDANGQPYTYNYDEVVAHEFQHVRQMERGMRFLYLGNYMIKNKGVGAATKGYKTNPYEVEAEFYEWAYSQGDVDIYGRSQSSGKNGGLQGARAAWQNKYHYDPIMGN